MLHAKRIDNMVDRGPSITCLCCARVQVDPEYSIVQECMPYMSRRLLTDGNPRMRAALKKMLYGDGSRLDIDRLQKLIGAFSNFTTGVNAGQHSKYSGPSFSAAFAHEEEHVKGNNPRSLVAEGPVITEAMKEALKVGRVGRTEGRWKGERERVGGGVGRGESIQGRGKRVLGGGVRV